MLPGRITWEVQTNTLDPKVYYDVGRFEAEHEHLFRRLPLCLGHVDQLAERGAVVARHAPVDGPRRGSSAAGFRRRPAC